MGGAGDRHSIVQANYQWKIITTDGSRLVLEHPGAPQQMMKPESAVGEREGGRGGEEKAAPRSHTNTHKHTRPDATFRHDGFICSMTRPDLRIHTWLPRFRGVTQNLRLPLRLTRLLMANTWLRGTRVSGQLHTHSSSTRSPLMSCCDALS